MQTLFRVEARQIEDLSDIQLTKLLKLLLHLEARTHGISESAVEVALNITVADGGEDGRIEWKDGPDKTEFLPGRLVQFQNKATAMPPAECAKEIVDSKGNLKNMVDKVLKENGIYIVFTNKLLNKEQIEERIDSIRNKLRELSNPFAEIAKIYFYDAAKIEGWVNKHLSAIVHVLNWLGRPLERGLKTWDDWGKDSTYTQFVFVPDPERETTIRNLRSLLNNSRKHARIVGLSGLGKTRLAFEVFRPQNDLDDLNKRVIYVDANANQQVLGWVTDLVSSGIEGIIVVDNCDISLHKSICKEVTRDDSKLSLLTLDYNLNNSGAEPNVVQLKQMKDDFIKTLLEQIYPSKSLDLDRITIFAQGFPKMAVLLASARLEKLPEMGSLNDDDLANKLLWGGNASNPDDEKILRGCALFEQFGLDEDASLEYKFIASFVLKIPDDDFYDCVKRFEERGLIDRRGRYVRVVPKPLAIRLASEWWKRTQPEKQMQLIMATMPGQLAERLCEQISFLDFLPEVKDLTSALCGTQGPFGQAEVILSSQGSNLFRKIVNTNPEAASKALYKILQKISNQEVFNIKGDVRRNLIYALERLCFHSESYDTSMKALIILASEENESWSNNATGLFKQLFQTFLSGTEALPDQRYKIIDYALAHEKKSINVLALNALDQILDTDNYTRNVGAEYQGSGEELKDWSPKVWGEAFAYWQEALKRLTDLTIQNNALGPDAKAIIGRHIRGLMHYGQIELIDEALRKVVSVQGPFWPEALEKVKDTIKYDTKKMPEAGKIALQNWEVLLTPFSIPDKLKQFVSVPSFENEKDENGHYVSIAEKNAKKLSHEITDLTQLIEHLPLISHGEQRQARNFGRELVIHLGYWEPLLTQTIKYIDKHSSDKDVNTSFLEGLLNGVFKIAPEEWDNLIQELVKNEDLFPFIIDLLTTGQLVDTNLKKIIELLGENKIKIDSLYNLANGGIVTHLPFKTLKEFVLQLAAHSNETKWLALDILTMYSHRDDEKWNMCKPVFVDILLDLSLADSHNETPTDSYNWQEVTTRIIEEGYDIDFIKGIFAKIFEARSIARSYFVKPVIQRIFELYGKEVIEDLIKEAKNSDYSERFYLLQLLDSDNIFDRRKAGVISSLPEQVLIDWCKSDPDFAPEFLASATNIVTEIDVENGKTEYQFSSMAKYLFDNFGSNEKVLNAISSNLSSFGWMGSVIPYYKKELTVVKTLLSHQNSKVKQWADDRVDYLESLISKAQVREQEKNWRNF